MKGVTYNTCQHWPTIALKEAKLAVSAAKEQIISLRSMAGMTPSSMTMPINTNAEIYRKVKLLHTENLKPI